MLDLFCGRWGWSRAFAARGWRCVGIDLVWPPSPWPEGDIGFQDRDVLTVSVAEIKLGEFDFICASPPCEQFSVHGMKHFHPNPPYPELGIKLFNHTRAVCEESGVPYVIENVRAAQQFVGQAVHHCGPFYLWGNGVPPLMNGGIKKGLDMGRDPVTGKRTLRLGRRSSHKSKARAADKQITATIPPELASCVAAYAERLCEQKAGA